MNSCIFIASYPNTREKIHTLLECIISARKSRLPIVCVSNMELPEEISSLVDDCLIGENIECRYEEFFTGQEIDAARNLTRYLCHFSAFEGDSVISYRPLYYGRGSTYHWAGITQQKEIVKYSRKNKISHVLILEGDIILNDIDVFKIKEKFSEMEKENLDFMISIQGNFSHMSGNGWFTSIDYWEKVINETTAEDFLKKTYPSFSSESYIVHRMKLSGGRGKILSAEEFSDKLPNSWIISKVEHPKDRQTNLLFPYTNKIGLSSSRERRKQNPLDPFSHIEFGVGIKEKDVVFFVWNRYSSSSVREVTVNIDVFNNDSKIFNSFYVLGEDCWSWSPVPGLEEESYCLLNVTTIDQEGKKYSLQERFNQIGGFLKNL